MQIQLCNLDFVETTLQSGTRVFRASTGKHDFQHDDCSQIKEGRFNKEHQYCFYIAVNEIAAILEIISHYQSYMSSTIYVKKLTLKKEIKLVNLTRWNYYDREGDKIHYKYEHIMINQHITCPKRDWSNWLYNSTQIIADYFRGNFGGLIYQTAIAHLLGDYGKQIYGHKPSDLFNYAIFKNPNECKELFDTSNDWVPKEMSSYLDFYNKNRDDDTIQKIIKCKNANETVPCQPSLRNNSNCNPSLDIINFV